MVTIFGTVVSSSEVNEQLTDDDLLSFVENQDNSSCVGELDVYLSDCNVKIACSCGKKTKTLISFQNYQLI